MSFLVKLHKSARLWYHGGLLQGSVMGLMLFVLYTVDLLRVIGDTQPRLVTTHVSYADDTQVYGFCRPTSATALTADITDCFEAAHPRCDQTGFKQIKTDEVRVVCDRPTATSATDDAAADRPSTAAALSLRSSLLVT